MIKTYEGFMDKFFKKPDPKVDPGTKEKIDKFLETASVEDIKYMVCDVTDELGQPHHINYWLEIVEYGSYQFSLTENKSSDRFNLRDYHDHYDEDLSKVPFSEGTESYFSIELSLHHNQDYTVSTDSETGDKNWEIINGLMERIKEEFKFSSSDFRNAWGGDGLKLIFKF